MSAKTPLNRAPIAERFGAAIEDLGFAHGVHAFAAPPELIVELCRFLKE
ncbi:MAG: NADH-quinone oxidoreductase subunit C, partial [Mesorhizobium sp.]